MRFDTRVRYAEVAKGMLRRFSDESNTNPLESLNEFLLWFRKKSKDWQSSTFRQRRSALIYYLQERVGTDYNEE